MGRLDLDIIRMISGLDLYSEIRYITLSIFCPFLCVLPGLLFEVGTFLAL